MGQEKDLYKRFGKILAYHRAINKLTQQNVADALGIGKTTYTYYENGERRIPLEHIISLSEVLGFNVGDVMSELKSDTIHTKRWFEKYASIDFTEDELSAIDDFISYTLSKRK